MEIPALIGLILGSGVISAVVTALVTRKTAKSQQMLDGWAKDREMFLQERIEDRRHRAALDAKLDTTIAALNAKQAALNQEQLYSTLLLQWGLAGAPPPPPTRQELALATVQDST